MANSVYPDLGLGCLLRHVCTNSLDNNGIFKHFFTVVTCDRPNTVLSSLSPDQSEYDYNTIVTYSCDLGYNRTGGDETRTCDHTAHWTGTEANCTCKIFSTVVLFAKGI